MKHLYRLCLSLSLVGFSSSVFAEDYYAPVPKELEPMARLAMPQFSLNDSRLDYILPKDLTGREIKLELARDTSAGDFPRIYRGEHADVACMGTNELPACVVTHSNLGINRDEAVSYLEQKYRDPKKLESAIKVLDTFAHGSQPLGVISKRSPAIIKDLPKSWSVEVLLNAKDNSSQSSVAKVTLDLGASSFVNTGAAPWPTSDVSIDGLHIRGDYQRAGMKHWFDVSVNTEKTSFEGTWGFFGADGKPLPASGVMRAQGG